MELVESKVKGLAIEVPEQEEEPVSINFMEALKKSLDRTRHEPEKMNGKHRRSTRHKKVS